MSDGTAGGFPDLSATEATRNTLHAYSRVSGAVRRAHAPAHPRWWHTSLSVGLRGLVMPSTPWPGRTDADFAIDLDMVEHGLTVEAAGETLAALDLREGLSASALGDRVVHILRSAGVHVAPERERYADEAHRFYDPDHAGAWLEAFRSAQRALGTVRDDLDGERSPIQLWPHHFDLSFEYFGTRVVTFVEEGEESEAASQIGFGFSSMPTVVSGAEPYFYATPWPFDAALVKEVLPGEAAWVTEAWQGALLPYAEARVRGKVAVEEFCVAVFELARSILT